MSGMLSWVLGPSTLALAPEETPRQKHDDDDDSQNGVEGVEEVEEEEVEEIEVDRISSPDTTFSGAKIGLALSVVEFDATPTTTPSPAIGSDSDSYMSLIPRDTGALTTTYGHNAAHESSLSVASRRAGDDMGVAAWRTDKVHPKATQRNARSLCSEIEGIFTAKIAEHAYDKHRHLGKKMYKEAIASLKLTRDDFRRRAESYRAETALLSQREQNELGNLITDIIYKAPGWENTLINLVDAEDRWSKKKQSRNAATADIAISIGQAVHSFMPELKVSAISC